MNVGEIFEKGGKQRGEKTNTKRKRGKLKQERRKEDTTRSSEDKTKGDTEEGRKVLKIAVSNQRNQSMSIQKPASHSRQIQPYI